MSAIVVGNQLLLTVTVTDKASLTLVDPGTFLFTLVAPGSSPAVPTGTYSWNGSVWTNSESTIAVPSRLSLGTFTLSITTPYANTYADVWKCGWKHTANGAGKGEGSGENDFPVGAVGVKP